MQKYLEIYHTNPGILSLRKMETWLLFNRDGFLPRESASEFVCSILFERGMAWKKSMNLQSEKL